MTGEIPATGWVRRATTSTSPPCSQQVPSTARTSDALHALELTALPEDSSTTVGPSPVAEALHRLGALGRPEQPAVPAWRSQPWVMVQEATSRGGQDRDEPHDSPLSRLSRAERRVVVLAANGCCNREIAQRLFITVSTVEQHLTKIYRKLGVKSRGELPSWTRHASAPR